jgi:hypothetical protein
MLNNNNNNNNNNVLTGFYMPGLARKQQAINK